MTASHLRSGPSLASLFLPEVGGNAGPIAPVARMLAAVAQLLALGLALQTLYTSFYGPFEPTLHRGLALAACAIAAVFCSTRVHGRYETTARGAVLLAFDVALVAFVVVGVVRLLNYYDTLATSIIDWTYLDQLSALLAILALIALSVRFFGLPLSIFAGLCLIYVFYGRQLPGILQHSGFDLYQVAETMWYSTQGIFGMPTGIVLQVIFIFVIFGAVLEHSGAGAALIRIALYLSRRSRAGPAYAAILSSAGFGTMSGSVTANVVGTGTITIPLVRARGFSPAFSGAVEAAASTGGQILPPVMGAAAFLMAELTGNSYVTIAAAALIPGLFFYASLFVFAGLEARRLGIETMTDGIADRLTRRDLIDSMMFVAPVVAIVAALIWGYTPTFAGLCGTVIALAFCFINPQNRQNPLRMVEGLIKGAVLGAELMIGVAVIGVIFGAISLSGVGLQIAILLSDLAGSGLFPALVMAAVACLILGMGMPTLPAYLIIVLVMGPTFSQLGVPLLAIHFFVFYFGVLSAITPPVALAVFAAAPIAGANPITTGLAAMKLAVVGFIVPFVIVYEPWILLHGDFSWGAVAYSCLRLAGAVWLLSTALTGFERGPLSPPMRVLRAACGVGLLLSIATVQLAAIAVAAVLIAAAVFTSGKNGDTELSSNSPA